MSGGKATTVEDVDDMDFPLPEPVRQPALPVPAPFEPAPVPNAAPGGVGLGQNADPGGVRIGQSYGGMRVVSDPGQFKRWICLYPLYFNRGVSVPKGRRVPLELAVADPHGRQLSMAVKEAGFNVCYEPNKRHPRDFFTPGRVRVKVFDDDGSPMNRDVTSRKELIMRVAAKMATVDAPRDKEPTLQDIIDSGALPALPGVPPPGMDSSPMIEDSSPVPSGSGAGTASTKASKKAAKAKKKKGKNRPVV
ncbi:signal recognition particle subunit [Coemansia sp. RSA 552]|nr:signal recognition particle subunit [Coemansia sp. RSA 552]